MATEHAKQATDEKVLSELNEPVWAVVSFEKIEVLNLTYSKAIERSAELEARGVPGLCIITNEAAIRMDTSTNAESSA